MGRIRPSYKRAVDFIAFNDEPTWDDEDDVSTQSSVHAVAVAFDLPTERVAKDVVRARLRLRDQEESMQSTEEEDRS